ncbi:MAG: hypothetical protein Q9181_003249 [Wetmoreana brouardii]
MSDVHQQGLVVRLATSFESGKYSDLSIICRDREFRVHRHILCTASKFFAAACDGNFKEARDSRIDLSEDDPDALERMLKYLYTADYDDMDHVQREGNKKTQNEDQSSSAADLWSAYPKDDGGSVLESSTEALSIRSCEDGKEPDSEAGERRRLAVSAPLNNVLVYALAEKYDIQTLKILSQAKFRSCSQEEWNDDDILTVLQLIYETTPGTDRGLRDIILNICSKHRDGLIRNTRFPGVLEKDSLLAYDMLIQIKKDLDSNISDLNKLYLHWKHAADHHESERDEARAWNEVQEKRLTEVISTYTSCRHCSNLGDAIETPLRTDIPPQQDVVVFHPPSTTHHRRDVAYQVLRASSLQSARLELTSLYKLLLGILTIGPWALIIVYDLLLWIFRSIYYVIPFVGGRARGKKRPRAPSLSERPSGRPRTFNIGGTQFTGVENAEKEGLRERILDTSMDYDPANIDGED